MSNSETNKTGKEKSSGSESDEKKNKEKSSGKFYQSTGLRSLIILILVGGVIGFFLNYDKVEWNSFIALAALIAMYLLDILYSITTSDKTSEFFKSFVFQTAVPIVALTVVCIMAMAGKIKDSAIITLFGMSLAYTTYVVGKKIKGEPVDPTDETK